MIACLGISTGRHDPSLHRTDTGVLVKFGGEYLSGEFGLLQMRKKLLRVHKNAVTADRPNDRNAAFG